MFVYIIIIVLLVIVLGFLIYREVSNNTSVVEENKDAYTTFHQNCLASIYRAVLNGFNAGPNDAQFDPNQTDWNTHLTTIAIDEFIFWVKVNWTTHTCKITWKHTNCDNHSITKSKTFFISHFMVNELKIEKFVQQANELGYTHMLPSLKDKLHSILSDAKLLSSERGDDESFWFKHLYALWVSRCLTPKTTRQGKHFMILSAFLLSHYHDVFIKKLGIQETEETTNNND